ncbi:TauD/TfdA family dioxygenase [Micromonospora sp. NPDC049891]|uniref:TauD/TfdA family dioxygenase n=1 Tax=Micromonospora sp. NPDC049891 TaxID=3155655 RepID=UPI0033DE9D19
MTNRPVTVDVPQGSGGVDWVRHRRSELRALLHTSGAVLLRGLSVRDSADVAAVRAALVDVAAGSHEPFAPRPTRGDGVHGDFQWPPDRELCPQHEQSYRLTVPRVVLLACLRPADSGGQTVLADARLVLARIPADVRDRLRTHGWLLARTFRERIGLSWREAFDVDTPAELAAALRRELIAHRWLDDATLRTVRRRTAVVHHPDTGEQCWFNHAGFLNEWGLDPVERQVMRQAFGEDLAFNTRAGDGSPLTAADVAGIEAAYAEVSVDVPLAAGDVLVLDNILTAHGRRAYRGPRDVVCAWGEPVDVADCRPTTVVSSAMVCFDTE